MWQRLYGEDDLRCLSINHQLLRLIDCAFDVMMRGLDCCRIRFAADGFEPFHRED